MRLSEAQRTWLGCHENGKPWPAEVRQTKATVDALIRKGCVMQMASGRIRLTPAGRLALQESDHE